MHLPKPERARGERDREDEDDRAPQALLLSYVPAFVETYVCH